MSEFKIADRQFTSKNISDLNLSIQLSLDGFSFCITSPLENSIQYFYHNDFDGIWNDELLFEKCEKIINKQQELNREFKQVKLFMSSPRFTFIPSDYFKKEEVKSYFELNHDLKSLDEIYYSEIKEINSFVIYPINSEISNLFYKKFNNIIFAHPVEGLVANGFNFAKEYPVQINVYKNFFNLVYFQEGKFHYGNGIEYTCDNDFTYYVLNIIKQLGLDNDIGILLSGEINRFNEKFKLLAKFASNVRLSHNLNKKAPLLLNNSHKLRFNVLINAN